MPRWTVSVIAPVAYVATLVAVTVVNGLPLGHTDLFLWILLGLAAFSVPAWRSWGRMLLEWLPLVTLLVVYDYLRGAVSVPDAQAHVAPQIAADRWLAGGDVPTVWLQQHLYDPDHLRWYDIAVWSTYLTHFVTIWIVAAVLWRVAHDRFGRYVSLMVLLTLMGFATYWLYPAQPPWLAGDHAEIPTVGKVVPTVWDHLGVGVAANLFDSGDGLVNLVAAMPSLHAAFPAALLLFFWNDGRVWRLVLGLYTLAMAFTLVYGGEHFVIDILAGWLFAAIAYTMVCVAARAWRAASLRPAPADGAPAVCPSPTTAV